MNRLLVSFSCLMAVCATATTTTLAFSPSRSHANKPTTTFQSRQMRALFLVKENDDFPPDESADYSGNVDWDAEWKKVVAKDGKLDSGQERPGKDFYKSEAEIAAIKAANTATKKVSEAGSTVGDILPDVRSLSGDWRFWIAVLALVSVGLSLLSAPSDINTGLSGDSFYV